MFIGLGLPLTRRRLLGGAYVGLLDQIGTSAFSAYSLRRLLGSFTGYAIKVRESAGNTEANIPFTSAGVLDTGALLAHCGSNSGFVTTWYDQVGSKHLLQATASAQPRIVNAGAVEVMGAKPSLRFLSGARYMQTDLFTAYTGNTLATAVAVNEDAADGFFRRIASFFPSGGGGDTEGPIMAMGNSATPSTGYAAYKSSTLSTVTADLGDIDILWSRYNGADNELSTQDATGSTAAFSSSFNAVRFGLASDTVGAASFGMTGYIAEAINFTTLPSAGDTTLLRDDMADFYVAS